MGRGIIERLVSAFFSHNLGDRGRQSDQLLLGAAGMAAHDHPVAMALFDLKYRVSYGGGRDGSAGSSNLVHVVEHLGTELRRRARHEPRWRIRRQNDQDRAVLLAVKWWLMSVCPACDGRQYEAIAGTPKLSDRHCHVCRGSGKRALQDVMRDECDVRCRDLLRDPVEWLVSRMDQLEAVAGEAYIRRLGATLHVTPWEQWN